MKGPGSLAQEFDPTGHALMKSVASKPADCLRGQMVDYVGLLLVRIIVLGYDPSAGSPTETLLRLLLPLGGRV